MPQFKKRQFQVGQKDRFEAILAYLKKTRSVRDIVVSGGDMANVPSSTRKRVVETYALDGDTLRAEVVTEDPVFLNEPIQFAIEWVPQDEPLILPYACLPELAIQPAQFIPSKYEDPNMFMFRLPAAFPPAGVQE